MIRASEQPVHQRFNVSPVLLIHRLGVLADG